MKSLLSFLLASCTLASLHGDDSQLAPIELSRLKVENLSTPTVTGMSPRFSWVLASGERGQRQTAYQIQMAGSEDALKAEKGLLWDSKKVESPNSHLVEVNVPKLPLNSDIYWRVKIWNHQDQPTEWSEPTHFKVNPKATLDESYADYEPAILSSFECSDPALNELFAKSRQARQEHLGDISSGAIQQLCARSFAFDAHVGPLYEKWLATLDEAQTEEKLYPAFLPSRNDEPEYAPIYSDAAVIVPFALWQMTGDDHYFRGRFENLVEYGMKRRDLDPDFNGKAFGTALHDKSDAISHELLSLTSFALDCRILGEMATAIPHPPYILQHNAWFDRVSKGFKRNFLTEENKLKDPTQTSRILALRYGVVPPEAKLPMAQRLGEQIAKEGLQTGPIGTSAVLPVLTWTGQEDKALQLVRGFAKESEADLVTLAASSEWMMSFAAGLNHQAAGFRASYLAPYFPAEDSQLTWVKAHHDTPYGRLSIHWKRHEDGKLEAEVAIPCNTNAIISLPAGEDATILESGKPVNESFGARIMRHANGRQEIIAQPGTYTFEVK
ncbi:MAG: alpha-L-rhamnosidase C-terminal domain-containing protein [Verrucomicrobiota bacterium JB023]|nr:alpha-L-rhamnosidase C-terminal domain-containing protein [Verrucomicrobiota bacterium JB023]